MKKYESILKKAEQYEKKQGITYATANSPAFKNTRLCLYLVYLYKLVMNLIYISGVLFMFYEAGREFDSFTFTGICLFTALMIVGRFFVYMNKTVLKTAGLCVMLSSLVAQLVAFAPIMRGSGGIRPAFYYMHLVPAAIMAMLIVILLVIIFRAWYIRNSSYKKIVANLYEAYRSLNSNQSPETLDEDAWEEFLKTYDPEIYKNQF